MRLLLPVLLAASATAGPVDSPQKGEPRPKLLILVAVDGLSFARLEYYRPWYRAGLKRLLDEGEVRTEARYRHINTETGPGHSALSTGAPPRTTGIVANEWYEVDPKGKYRSRYCVEEWNQGASTMMGPTALRIPTLGDLLLETHPESRVVSLSAKDRAAILMAGHNRKEAVYWFDQVTGSFGSSAAYEPSAEARAIVERVNQKGAGPGRFGLVWKPLPLEITGEKLPQPARDIADFQLPLNGLGFPHSLTFSPRGYFPSLYATPFIDEYLADLALAFLEDPALALGRKTSPDFLAISFSAQDVIAHSYGAESEENLDVLRRLDVQLGRVFAAMDRLGLTGSVALGFSADHGFPELPEVRRARDAKVPGGRIVDSNRAYPTFIERLNRLVDEELCLDAGARPLLDMKGWTLAYNRGALPLTRAAGPCGAAGAKIGAPEIDEAVLKVVPKAFHEEIEGILLNSRRSTWSDADPNVEFARNDFDVDRSGDAVLLPREQVVLTSDPARGTSHGSHHEYDIHVPLIFWGRPFPSGRPSGAATPYDLAPTLAATIALPLPQAVGHALVP
jgi:hypothetical protein